MTRPLDEALWLAKLTAPRGKRRRYWTAETRRQLEQMIGKFSVNEMAQRLGIPPTIVSTHLNQQGYSISRDIHAPLGINLINASKKLKVPYTWLWHKVKRGELIVKRLNKKDYRLSWRQFKALQREVVAHQRRRERWLAHIKEPVITKKQFDQMIGLSETQAHRYLIGKTVRAWKIPCEWEIGASHKRWEWRVSKADAERVTRLRAEGKLKLGRKEFQKIVKASNAEVARLRRARRLGKRDDLKHRLSTVVPGAYNVRQVASHVGLDEQSVYMHIHSGRLKAVRKKVGRRFYWVIYPEALPPYLEWTKRGRRATGPIVARRKEIEAVVAASYLTVKLACAQYPDMPEIKLRAAVQTGRVPSIRIGRMIALKQKDVRTFVKGMRRWKEMQAHDAKSIIAG